MSHLTEKLSFYPYRIFNEDSGSYLYSLNNNKIFEIDEKVEKLLNQEGKDFEQAYHNVADVFTEQEFSEVISQMEEAFFIKTAEADLKIEKAYTKEMPDSISSITLMIVQECNMRCSYCYGEAGEYHDRGKMKFSTAQKAIDFLLANSQTKELSICLFGGEPLLNFNLFKQVVAYCKEKEAETDKIFRFTTTTNGTLINEEIERFFTENKITVQISLDGDRETHDRNRYFQNRIGSYDMIVENTKNMRENSAISCRATITKKGFDLVSNFEHLYDLNFRAIPMSPAYNLLKDEDYPALTEEYNRLIDHYEQLIKKGDRDRYSKLSIFTGFMRKIHQGSTRALPCGVGWNMYAIDINGDIYPCHRFVSNKEYVLGNINTKAERRDSFIEEINVSNHKQCDDCWARNLCIGGCPNENLNLTGNVTEMSEPVCDLTKNIFERLIRLYIRLTPEEKERFFNPKQTAVISS